MLSFNAWPDCLATQADCQYGSVMVTLDMGLDVHCAWINDDEI